jgi:hypothetical protein
MLVAIVCIGGGDEPLFVVSSRPIGFEPIIPTNDGVAIGGEDPPDLARVSLR